MEYKILVVIAVVVSLTTALVVVASAYSWGMQPSSWMWPDMMGSGAGMMQGGMMGGRTNISPNQRWQMQPSVDCGAEQIMGDMMSGMMNGMMRGMRGGDGYGMNCPSGYRDGQTSSQNYVSIMGYSFLPQTLTIKKGQAVTWVNMDMVIHTVESGTHDAPQKLFDSGTLEHMEGFSYTFSEPGAYVYHCDPHPYMEGKIVVTD